MIRRDGTGRRVTGNGRWRLLAANLLGALVLCGLAVGCGGSATDSAATPVPPAATSQAAAPAAGTMSLVFVISPDLNHNAGDVDPTTSNLTNQGLQRALLLAPWLHDTLLGSTNVTAIYGLEPATHPQTANGYPDVTSVQIAQQFAMLNQYSELVPKEPGANVVADTFPIHLSYARPSVPPGAADPELFSTACQGIDYADAEGVNETLVNGLLARQQPGSYVFVVPFDTFQALLTNLRAQHGYTFTVPQAWQGPNVVYDLQVRVGSGEATLAVHDTRVQPRSTYPVLTPPCPDTPTHLQTPTAIETATTAGATVPTTVNRNETVYFIRHAEAHPTASFDNGGMVRQGDWRALYMPYALQGKIHRPDHVFGVDPTNPLVGPAASGSAEKYTTYSYVRPSQTVACYAIANGMPLELTTSFLLGGVHADSAGVVATVDFFFTGGRFSGKTVLVDWEHLHIPPIGQNLVNRYFAVPAAAPAVPSWPSDDYDTIWTFTLDGSGNLTMSNLTSEGMPTSSLPTTPIVFK